MKDGSTGLKNSPTAMAAMVNDVIEKSDVLKNALGNTRADGEDPPSLRQIGQVLDSLPKYRNAFQVGLWNMVGMILVNNMYCSLITICAFYIPRNFLACKACGYHLSG